MKRVIYTFFALWLSIFSLNAQKIQQTKAKGRPTVAVVLAGGGAKGTAHIGALKVIEACGIPIDIVVGTSMGSIVGGLYSIGYTTDEMEFITRNTDWVNLILDTPDYGNRLLTSKKDNENYMLRVALDRSRMLSGTGGGGIIHGKNISALFNHLTEGVPRDIKFNQFPITFACVATDAITGEKYVFHEGDITTAMRSSMAIPSIFTPVKLGDKALVDGFVVDNYPVDVARDLGADIVIGVDLVSDITDDALANSAMDLVMRLMDMISEEQYQKNIADTDIYIKVDTKGYSAASFNTAAVDSLINRGQEAGLRCVDQLSKLAKRLDVKPNLQGYYHPRMDGVTYYHTIEDISNIDQRDAKLNKHEKDSINESLIEMGYNFAKRVFESGSLKLGGRFDSQDYAAIQFGIDLRLLKKKRVDASIYARLGSHLVGGLSVGRVFNNGSRFEVRYKFEKKNLRYYNGSERFMTFDDIHNRFNIRYKHIWSKVSCSYGLRYDTDNYLNPMFYKDAPGGLILDNYGNKDRFFSYYAKAEFNNLNSLYFPTKGSQVETMLELITTNMHNYKGYAPIPIVSAYWRTALPLTKRLTIIPQIQARMMFMGEIELKAPLALLNIVGGLHRDMWKEQQMTMAGLPNMEYIPSAAAIVGGFELQQRIWKNHYIVADIETATCCDKIDEAFDSENVKWGINLGYQLRTFVGPISLTGMYNSHTKEGAVVLNIGYYFL